jgi:hypothetical protein
MVPDAAIEGPQKGSPETYHAFRAVEKSRGETKSRGATRPGKRFSTQNARSERGGKKERDACSVTRLVTIDGRKFASLRYFSSSCVAAASSSAAAALSVSAFTAST